MKLEETLQLIKNKQLREGLQFLKFRYNGKDRTIKHPQVKLLDPFYKGQKGQKTYGKRSNDLLGWSISHVKNKKYAKAAIDDITDFASFFTNDTEEVYKRIKQFYGPQSTFIRRYIRQYMKGLREKKPGKMLWRKIGFDKLIKFKKF